MQFLTGLSDSHTPACSKLGGSHLYNCVFLKCARKICDSICHDDSFRVFSPTRFVFDPKLSVLFSFSPREARERVQKTTQKFSSTAVCFCGCGLLSVPKVKNSGIRRGSGYVQCLSTAPRVRDCRSSFCRVEKTKNSDVKKMFESVPRWARVSAVIAGVCIGSEVLYEVYLGWKSICQERRARQRANSHINEVYFTNERSIQANAPGTTMANFQTEHVCRIVALLDRARVSINLGMYIITVSSIGDALLRAANRGVRVRVVGCSSMAYSTGSQMTKLANAGNFGI